MPFDATTAVRSQSVLEKIGLVPVPDEVLAAHKHNYAFAYHARPGAYRAACWQEYRAKDFRSIRNGDDGMFSWLSRQSASRTGYEPTMQAPSEVQSVVMETERRMRDAGIEHERVLGMFYTDPYVRVNYVEDGHWKTACLAIWDQGKVLHIAKLYD